MARGVDGEVTQASTAEITDARQWLAPLHAKHPLVRPSAQVLTADRGSDDSTCLRTLGDVYGIKRVVAIRNLWKEGETTRWFPGYDTVTDNNRGDVSCHHPATGEAHPMANGGFKADRTTLKKRCPTKFSGITCDAQATCPVAQGIRIPLDTYRRVLMPIDRRRDTWGRDDAHLMAVERVNSRLNISFGFELHTIRGMAKVRARCGLALLVMVGLVLGRIRRQHPELLRSLVRSA